MFIYLFIINDNTFQFIMIRKLKLILLIYAVGLPSEIPTLVGLSLCLR